MITLRPSQERGQTKIQWLDSRHSFSFNHYFDRQHMGFQHLRVINEDWIKAGAGFGTHSHADMEIITYVMEGTLAHKDSTGGMGTILPGDVQRMTAGTGISHSEFNYSQTEPVHLFQVWILPNQNGLTPGYEQRQFTLEDRQDKLCLVAAHDGRNGALTIHQDVDLYVSSLSTGTRLMHGLSLTRHAWVQVAQGEITVNGVPLQTGDGAAISHEEQVEIMANQPAEMLLFDLATNESGL